MIKFANMSIVLSASGKTKILMMCSIGALLLNTICNIMFYHIFGFIGPAIATVVVTVLLTVVLAEMSANSLETSILNLIDWNEILRFIGWLVIMGVVCFSLKRMLEMIGINSLIILFFLGTTYIIAIFWINKKKIFSAMKEINALR